MALIDDCRENMNKSVQSLHENLATLHAGKVTAQLLDKVFVKVYGDNMVLKSVAGIGAMGPTTLSVKPYDPSTSKDILSGLNKTDLGCSVVQNGTSILLKFPTPSEDRRKDLEKQAKKYTEDGKVAIRNIRKDFNNEVKKDATLSEDMASDLKDQIQKETDKATAQMEKLLQDKIKDIETI